MIECIHVLRQCRGFALLCIAFLFCGSCPTYADDRNSPETIAREAFNKIFPDMPFKQCSDMKNIPVHSCHEAQSVILSMTYRLWLAKSFLPLEVPSPSVSSTTLATRYPMKGYKIPELNDFLSAEAMRFAECLERECIEVIKADEKVAVARRWREVIMFVSCVYNTRLALLKGQQFRAKDTFDVYEDIIQRSRSGTQFSIENTSYCFFPDIDVQVLDFAAWRPVGNVPFNFKTQF